MSLHKIILSTISPATQKNDITEILHEKTLNIKLIEPNKRSNKMNIQVMGTYKPSFNLHVKELSSILTNPNTKYELRELNSNFQI